MWQFWSLCLCSWLPKQKQQINLRANLGNKHIYFTNNKEECASGGEAEATCVCPIRLKQVGKKIELSDAQILIQPRCLKYLTLTLLHY